MSKKIYFGQEMAMKSHGMRTQDSTCIRIIIHAYTGPNLHTHVGF